MAADVLAGCNMSNPKDTTPFRHAVDHDLESFVFIILYMAVMTPGYPDALEHFFESLRVEEDISLISLSVSKRAFWTDMAKQWSEMAGLLKSHPLWTVIQELHDVLDDFRGKEDASKEYQELYEDFLSRLESSRNAIIGQPSNKRPLESSFAPDAP
jgi:hypothetical protein